MKCKICNSPYLDEINNLLKRGESAYRIEKLLRDKYDVVLSHDTINRHRKNHLLPLHQGDDLVRLLHETGNYRLVKRIEKTKKITKQYPKCTCSYSVRPVKRRGLVFLCTQCNGWIRGDIGRSIQKEQKRQRREGRSKQRLGFVVKRRRF